MFGRGTARWCVPLLAAMGVTTAVVAWSDDVARAEEKKKKPGLFEFERWKSPAQRQKDASKQLLPGQLDLTPAGPPGEPRVVRLRVYADRDYRQAVMRWQGKVRGQIDRVNRVVQPVLGVRFEIEGL